MNGGGTDLILGFVSMLRDLVRGRLPRDPYGFAVLLLIVLVVLAGIVLIAAPALDGWVSVLAARILP